MLQERALERPMDDLFGFMCLVLSAARPLLAYIRDVGNRVMKLFQCGACRVAFDKSLARLRHATFPSKGERKHARHMQLTDFPCHHLRKDTQDPRDVGFRTHNQLPWHAADRLGAH